MCGSYSLCCLEKVKDTAKTLLTPKSYASKQKSWFICASLSRFTIPFSESHCTFVLFVLSLLCLTYKYYNTLHWIPLHSCMHRYWYHSHRMYCLRMCGSRSRRCPEKVRQEQWKLNTLLTGKNKPCQVTCCFLSLIALPVSQFHPVNPAVHLHE